VCSERTGELLSDRTFLFIACLWCNRRPFCVFVALLQQYNVRMILTVASKTGNLCVFTVKDTVRDTQEDEKHSELRHKMRR